MLWKELGGGNNTTDRNQCVLCKKGEDGYDAVQGLYMFIERDRLM